MILSGNFAPARPSAPTTGDLRNRLVENPRFRADDVRILSAVLRAGSERR